MRGEVYYRRYIILVNINLEEVRNSLSITLSKITY